MSTMGYIEHQQQRRRRRRTKGSRLGYYADIDDLPSVSEEDDFMNMNAVINSITITTDITATTPFYTHIRPRRRNKKNKSHSRTIVNPLALALAPPSFCSHPDIDLSLVSLMSSEEFDRRSADDSNFLNCCSSSSSEISNDHTSSVRQTSSPLDQQTINNNDEMTIKYEQKFKYNTPSSTKTLSRPCPLAAIDYGSIELDMSGSLLDSIYKIDCTTASTTTSRNSRDWMFGARSFTLNNNEPRTKRKCNANWDNKSNEQDATAVLEQPAHTVTSSRSSEVETVIASLKSIPDANNKRRISPCHSSTTYSLEGREHKRQKITTTQAPELETRRVHKTSTTSLEDAISFSPFARVLFSAQGPYNIVHANAAYNTLVQKGLATPCIVGKSFSASNDDKQAGGEHSEDRHISRMVEEHIGELMALEGQGNLLQENHSSILSRRKLQSFGFGGFNVGIFPIMPNDDICIEPGSPYESRSMESNLTRSSDKDYAIISSSQDHLIATNYVSHYLLQIEPCRSAKIPQCKTKM